MTLTTTTTPLIVTAVGGDRHAMTVNLADEPVRGGVTPGPVSPVWQMPVDTVAVIATALPVDEHVDDVVYTVTVSDDDEHAVTSDEPVSFAVD